MRFRHTALLAAALTLLADGALAAEPAGKEAAHERHHHFEALGDSFETLEKQAKKSKPDAAIVQREAAQVAKLGRQIQLWFPPGSGPGNGFKTHAKAEVWTDMPAFNDLLEKFVVAADQLNQKAAAGDMSVMAAAVEHTGEACSECHKKFRKEKSLFSIFGD
jgi:cytochrome c556